MHADNADFSPREDLRRSVSSIFNHSRPTRYNLSENCSSLVGRQRSVAPHARAVRGDIHVIRESFSLR